VPASFSRPAPAPASTNPPERPGSSRLAQEVQQVLARSSSLSSPNNIQVGIEGDAVVLRGEVSDDHERRLAANLARLTPGVRDVRNQLRIRTAPPATR
jgi:osmotically-inducible protein OsmY